MNISENFELEEFIKSDTATLRGINNEPDEKAIENLTALVKHILQPLRDAYGKPIHISSGYRSKELNEAINGSKTSQHMQGKAADIDCGNVVKNAEIFKLIQELDLPFDQLIDEKKLSWVHVSYDPDRNRKQILRLN